MNSDPELPVADDDFPEFFAPPQHRPARAAVPEKRPAAKQVDDEAQGQVDDVIARLRRERAEGKR